jgi:TatD DNase family protein
MSVKDLALVDVHCHIDLFEDPHSVAEEAESRHIYTIAVTNTPSVYAYTESMVEGLSYVRPAVGLHPELAATRKHELSQMWQILKRTRYVGEIGLDYQTTDESDRQAQVKVLEQVLACCAEYGNKVLTVHSRRAAGDVISVIGKDYPGKIILHWYSGSIRELKRALNYGFYFSVNSAMVKSKRGRNLISKIPRDRLLTETDGPFIRISGELANPRHVSQVLEGLGEIWSIGFDEARGQVLGNFRDLLH